MEDLAEMKGRSAISYEQGFSNMKVVSAKIASLKESLKIKEAKSAEEVNAKLKEAQTSSDFVSFVDILERELLKSYADPLARPEYDLNKIVGRKITRDFRDVKVYIADEMDDLLEVFEKENYIEGAAADELVKQYALKKWGRLFTASWEAFINDDLGEIMQIPAKLVKAANRRRFQSIHSVFALNLSFFSNAHGNLITAVLGEAGIETAINAFMAQTDAKGNPIYVMPRYLVVGVSNVHAAKRVVADYSDIVKAITRANAPLNYGLEYIIDPRITGNDWYLFADPSDLKAVELLLLRGHEQPELFIKDSDAKRMSEFGTAANADPFDGDFYNDDIEFKGRDCHNTAVIDPRAAVMSTGAGS